MMASSIHGKRDHYITIHISRVWQLGKGECSFLERLISQITPSHSGERPRSYRRIHRLLASHVVHVAFRS